MDTLWVESGSAEVMGPKWSKVLILSLVCHLAIFSTIFFIPGQMSGRGVRSVIYEVNLVEMPEEKQSKAEEGAISKAGKRLTGPKKAAPAKRVVRPKKKRKPVVIAKRTLPTKRQKVKKPEVSSSELIDRALSRIERKIKAEKKDPIDQAISKLEGQVKRAAAKGYTGGQADRGVSIRIYQIEVESRIKGNWSYPVAILGPGSRKDLEAIVVVRVKNNGAILESWFRKRSSNVIFDQSVLKALERSDPLPPFPEHYRKTYDEIEINFNLRELEGL